MQSTRFQGHRRTPYPGSAKWMKLYIRVFSLLPPNLTPLGFFCPGSKSLTLNAGWMWDYVTAEESGARSCCWSLDHLEETSLK